MHEAYCLSFVALFELDTFSCCSFMKSMLSFNQPVSSIAAVDDLRWWMFEVIVRQSVGVATCEAWPFEQPPSTAPIFSFFRTIIHRKTQKENKTTTIRP